MAREEKAALAESRDETTQRVALSYEAFKGSPAGRHLDVELSAEGSNPLAPAEFKVLRCYTGPLYEKYNCILRAGVSVFFQKRLKELCCGSNRYSTTLHVLSAAIVKLGKLTKVSTVYRAPGRAQPPSFWRAAMSGLAGVVEAGCLSCSSRKQVAMDYASLTKAKLLFEVQLGFVARGADLGAHGLSQYPSEAEILMPPVTALQVLSHRVEQDVVVVVLRPTIPSIGICVDGTS